MTNSRKQSAELNHVKREVLMVVLIMVNQDITSHICLPRGGNPAFLQILAPCPSFTNCRKMRQSSQQCCEKATVVSLTTGYVAWLFRSVRCIVLNRPSMLNVCVINLSWEQYDNYSLGVSYYEQLPAHLSNTQVVETQL